MRTRGPLPAQAVSAMGAFVLVGAVLGATSASPPAAAQTQLPSDCASPNPFIFTTCFARGTQFGTEPAIVAFRDAPDKGDAIMLASVDEVGATYGLAFDPARQALYIGAYQRRHTHFGPLGPGGIYRLHLDGRRLEHLTTVPGAGPDEHDPDDDYEPDYRGRDWVGKTSLGDLELSQDGSELYVMNLRDRHIHRYAVESGEWTGAFPHGASGEGWAADARPFALAMHAGWLYHSVVNTAFSTGENDQVRGYIYASRADGTDLRLVAEVDFGYDRGRQEPWRAWPVDEEVSRQTVQLPHPIVTGIAFDRAGNMLLGIRDRFLDTGPSVDDRELFRVAPGDILLLVRDGGQTWTFDPAEPKHYGGNMLEDLHDSVAIGAVLQLPGRDVVVSTAVDPLRALTSQGQVRGNISSGVIWFDNATGADLGRVELVYNELRHDGPQGKAQGLGDLALACVEQEPTATPTSEVTPFTSPEPSPTASATSTSEPTPTTVVPTLTAPVATTTGTPGPTRERPAEAPTPTATWELPALPQTGAGGSSGVASPWVWLLALVSVGCLGWAIVTRRRTV